MVIRELSRDKKISIEEIARRIGMTGPGLHDIIKRNSTKQSTLQKIADVLDVPLSTFYQEMEPESDPKDKTISSLVEMLKERDFKIQQLEEELAEYKRTSSDEDKSKRAS